MPLSKVDAALAFFGNFSIAISMQIGQAQHFSSAFIQMQELLQIRRCIGSNHQMRFGFNKWTEGGVLFKALLGPKAQNTVYPSAIRTHRGVISISVTPD